MALACKDEFLQIWRKMMSRKDSEFFRDPVDWEGLGLFDYPVIIKHPMDLSTIKNKLDKGLYRMPSELAADVRLVFSNAMTYNLPGSKVYNHARSLSDFWESNWAQIANADDAIDRPPSIEALTEFVEKCHRIAPEELGRVLRKLDELSPNCILKKPNSNEVDVNTDLINGRTFHEISSFLDNVIMDAGGIASRKGKKP